MKDSFFRLDEFFDYFLGIKERSPRTLKEYRYDLLLFFRYLKIERSLAGDFEEIEDISVSDIDDAFLRSVKLTELYRFVAWLTNDRKVKTAGRARKISALRTFFSFLHNKLHIIDNNPASELELPKKAQQLPRYLSVDESVSLLDKAQQADHKFAERDYCILTLFLNCGMRLSELVSIDIKDIKDDTITVVGKGNKERVIYLNSLCIDAIQKLLAVHEPAKKPDEQALFVSRNRHRISNRAVQNIVKKYLLQAGLDPERYSTHKLRHTAATLMYQHGGADLRSLQQILGHSSIATTEIYTHVNQDMLHRAVDQHPLNQLKKASTEE